jgi:hypothetical protein
MTNRDGTVYHLTAQPGAGGASAIESYEPNSGAGVVTVWGAPGPAANPDAVKVLPVGLTPGALYDVSLTTGLAAARSLQAMQTDTGANLMSGGIAVPLDSTEGATLVMLTKR